MSGKTTLSDIAGALGISVATVHRALAGRGRISEKTRQAVIQKAREMGYNLKVNHGIPAGKEIKTAFICPNNFFYQEIIDGAKAAADEYKAFGFTTEFFLSDDYSIESQIKQLNYITKSGIYDGIVISPTHTMLLNPLIKTLSDKNIPAVTVNNDISSSLRACFVGENSYVSGQIASEMYSSILAHDSNIAVMQSLVSAEGLKKRIEGFCDFVKSSRRLKLMGIYDFYDNIENAFETSKQIILNTDADGIFVNSMIGTIGILKAIREFKSEKPPFIIGYDLNDEIKDAIRDGIIFGTLFQSPYRQGYYAIKILFKIISNDDKILSKKIFHIPSQLIIKSNLTQFTDDNRIELDTWLK